MSYIQKLILIVLVYLLFYKPEFSFLPCSLNLLFGSLGFMTYIFAPKEKKYILKESQTKVQNVIKYALPFFIISIFSCILNESRDFYYIKYFFSIILGFYFSYLVAFLFYKIYDKISFKQIIEYLLIAHTIYVLLSILMFINPSIQSFLMSLMNLDTGVKDAYSLTEGVRLFCFGASYFTSGIINGFILIILGLYILNYSHSFFKQIYLYILFFLFFLIGMMMARTTLIGGIFAVFILCYSWIKSGFINILKTIVFLFISCALIIFIISKISNTVAGYFETLSQFAFEMFINYNQTKSFSTSSSNHLIEMYAIIPNSFSTWLIGDAKWTTSEGFYYMYTDVGYFRNIFYFGIIGMLSLLLYYYNIVKYVISKSSLSCNVAKMLCVVLFFYSLILNLKGTADLYFYIIPFVFCFRYDITR